MWHVTRPIYVPIEKNETIIQYPNEEGWLTYFYNNIRNSFFK